MRMFFFVTNPHAGDLLIMAIAVMTGWKLVSEGISWEETVDYVVQCNKDDRVFWLLLIHSLLLLLLQPLHYRGQVLYLLYYDHKQLLWFSDYGGGRVAGSII